MNKLPRAVIFGFDGVLADDSALAGAPALPVMLGRSPLHQPAQLARLERSIGHRVIIIASRPERERPAIGHWLERHDLTAHELILMADGEIRPAAWAAGAALTRLRQGLHIVHAYESRADVARAYENMSVPVTRTDEAAAAPVAA